MRNPGFRVFAALSAAAGIAAACGASPGSVSTVAPPPMPSASVGTPSPKPAPTGCASGFQVRSGHTTIRISEKVGPVTIHEAVLEAEPVTGGFALATGGGFEQCSVLVLDLRGLKSTDQFPGPESTKDRDEVVHKDFLKTATYPYALLRPRSAGNLPGPLPLEGHWSFAISGELTFHDHTRDVTWQVDATRQGPTVKAAATTTIGFDDFAIDRPNQILGLDEKIRIEVTLEADATR